jgi:hypothetical protein
MAEATKPATKQDNRMTIKDVRIAYAQGIFEARAAKPGDKPKFGAAFLFPKDHPCVKDLSAAVIRAANAKWGAKANEMLAMLKAADRLPIHSGDAKATSAGYAGNLYLNAGNAIRPLVLNANNAPLTASDGKPYSGCYVNVIVEIWPQDNQHGKRINASLLGVQFVRDGERLAGGSVATADDFEPIPGAADAAGGEQTDPASLFA